MDYNTILVIVVIFGGFAVVTIMMQLLGKTFSWHAELD
jgi:hypothetical protein